MANDQLMPFFIGAACAGGEGSAREGAQDSSVLSSYLVAVCSLTLALLMRAVGGWLQARQVSPSLKTNAASWTHDGHMRVDAVTHMRKSYVARAPKRTCVDGCTEADAH